MIIIIYFLYVYISYVMELLYLKKKLDWLEEMEYRKCYYVVCLNKVKSFCLLFFNLFSKSELIL